MVSWKVNSVFIGLNEDCWLGINGVPAQYAGQNYINYIKSLVSAAEGAGLYPVIGFFWGASGSTLATGQPSMPDNDHTPLFWEQVANTFKGDPNVILRLQEEPHPYEGSGLGAWKCWSQGDVQYGTTSDLTTPPTPTSAVKHCGEGYSAVGFQSLINIVRGTGATNVIQVPGLEWANSLTCGGTTPSACGFLDSADGVEVHDTLSPSQLMADVDVYPSNQNCGADGVHGPPCTTADYNRGYAPVIAVMPFEAGETGPQGGSSDSDVDTFLAWMDGQHSGYYGWVWQTGSGNLITDYNGTPESPWGVDYKNHLAGL
jgi:hypothetical protein